MAGYHLIKFLCQKEPLDCDLQELARGLKPETWKGSATFSGGVTLGKSHKPSEPQHPQPQNGNYTNDSDGSALNKGKVLC